MMTPKTLSNIFARRVLEDPKHSIFFVGYADPLSPAGILRAAQPGELVSLDPDEPPRELRCQIESFQFSAHASRESILAYIKKLAPKKVVLVARRSAGGGLDARAGFGCAAGGGGHRAAARGGD